MNTADRSLAMVDYALRRRFAFIDLAPEFSSSKFKNVLKAGGANSEMTDKIVTRMNGLNQSIFDDARNLGRGYRIGHSFFCPSNENQANEEWYQQVIKYEIAPLLREYWLDDESRAQSEIDKLQAK
jgi:5-methylcytosine-specific restriction protein B